MGAASRGASRCRWSCWSSASASVGTRHHCALLGCGGGSDGIATVGGQGELESSTGTVYPKGFLLVEGDERVKEKAILGLNYASSIG